MNRIFVDDPANYLDWREGSGGTVEIYDICVGTERRKGLGRRLVNKLYREIPDSVKLVWAVTRADNFIAQHFYEGLRFRVVGVLRNFYQDEAEAGGNHAGGRGTVDAIMYGRDIGSQA